MVWILAIIFCFTGMDPSLFILIKDFWGLFAVVTTAIAYPIGILVDTFADKLLEGWNEKIKKQHNLPADFSLLNLLHEKNDPNITSYFTYNRFKTRVARSSFINFAMIGIAVGMFVLLQGPPLGMTQSGTISMVIFVTFILLSVMALLLWREIAKTVYEKCETVRA